MAVGPSARRLGLSARCLAFGPSFGPVGPHFGLRPLFGPYGPLLAKGKSQRLLKG